MTPSGAAKLSHQAYMVYLKARAELFLHQDEKISLFVSQKMGQISSFSSHVSIKKWQTGFSI